ncbi:hypothetical protein HDU86_007256 [Geranomyces michiganensis]|nr:hypothetical protein HDU86_007256 [Geranomyces michiganensis]
MAAAATIIPQTGTLFRYPPPPPPQVAKTAAAVAIPKPEQVAAYRIYAASEIAFRAITRALLEMDMLAREMRTVLQEKGWDVPVLELGAAAEQGMRIRFIASPRAKAAGP